MNMGMVVGENWQIKQEVVLENNGILMIKSGEIKKRKSLPVLKMTGFSACCHGLCPGLPGRKLCHFLHGETSYSITYKRIKIMHY